MKLLFAAFLLASSAFAEQESEQKNYAGGRDEQDIVVQVTLPLATRTPDSQAGGDEVVIPGETTEETE